MFQQQLFLESGAGKTIKSIHLKKHETIVPIIEETTTKGSILHVPIIYIS